MKTIKKIEIEVNEQKGYNSLHLTNKILLEILKELHKTRKEFEEITK